MLCSRDPRSSGPDQGPGTKTNPQPICDARTKGLSSGSFGFTVSQYTVVTNKGHRSGSNGRQMKTNLPRLLVYASSCLLSAVLRVGHIFPEHIQCPSKLLTVTCYDRDASALCPMSPSSPRPHRPTSSASLGPAPTMSHPHHCPCLSPGSRRAPHRRSQ